MEDEIYHPLLEDIDVETLMEDDRLEIDIDTRSQNELLGVEQEDPALRHQGNLVARERLGTSGVVQEDGCSCHNCTVVANTVTVHCC